MRGITEDILAALRADGWGVAVHNDYRLDGQTMTFWLLTHAETGRFIKGEGPTDQDALEQCWVISNGTVIAARNGDDSPRRQLLIALWGQASRLRDRINSAEERFKDKPPIIRDGKPIARAFSVDGDVTLGVHFAEDLERIMLEAAKLLELTTP